VDPQQQQAVSTPPPIDLSAGLVPKAVDLSAGLVPKPPADTGSKEGFFHSLAAQFGMTPEQIDAQHADDMAHPVKTVLKGLMGPGGAVIEGLYNQGKMSLGEVADAVKSVASGDNAGAVVHAVKAAPIVGPAIDKMAQQAPPLTGSYMHQVGQVASNPAAMGTGVGAAVQAAPLALSGLDAAAPARPIIPNPPVGQVLGRVALLGKTPEAAYESAMKPSPALPATDRAAVVQTGLENAIPVSKAGVAKIGDLIDDLNQKIKDTIAADPNRPIDPNAVATRADIAKQKFAQQVNAQPDLDAIEASKQQFLKEQGAIPQAGIAAPPMNADDAQAMKQGTYRVLAGKYGEQGSASVEAQKALARGLKEEIATQFPELNNLNAAESRLLDLQPVLERAVNRISNHQAIGIGTPIAGIGAEALTGSTTIGRVAMVMKGILDNPGVKSRLAIAVSKANKIPISTATSRVNAYAASLGSTAVASQANSSSDNSDQAASQPPSQ
jgi:hypothetical protein